MTWSVLFFTNSFFLGIALAMDAFSVSIANGLNEPHMKKTRMCIMAGVYGLFQFAMPLAGWFCVHTIVEHFKKISFLIPWIALALLSYIAVKMIIESVQHKEETEVENKKLKFSDLIIQGIATSIDALSVGFTTAEYDFPMTFVSSFIICAVTFAICMGGLAAGKRAGKHLTKNAGILGGIILIAIGIEIFIKGIFF